MDRRIIDRPFNLYPDSNGEGDLLLVISCQTCGLLSDRVFVTIEGSPHFPDLAFICPECIFSQLSRQGTLGGIKLLDIAS